MQGLLALHLPYPMVILWLSYGYPMVQIVPFTYKYSKL